MTVPSCICPYARISVRSDEAERAAPRKAIIRLYCLRWAWNERIDVFGKEIVAEVDAIVVISFRSSMPGRLLLEVKSHGGGIGQKRLSSPSAQRCIAIEVSCAANPNLGCS